MCVSTSTQDNTTDNIFVIIISVLLQVWLPFALYYNVYNLVSYIVPVVCLSWLDSTNVSFDWACSPSLFIWCHHYHSLGVNCSVLICLLWIFVMFSAKFVVFSDLFVVLFDLSGLFSEMFVLWQKNTKMRKVSRKLKKGYIEERPGWLWWYNIPYESLAWFSTTWHCDFIRVWIGEKQDVTAPIRKK